MHPSPDFAPAGLINTLGLSSGRNNSGIGVDTTIPGDLLILLWGELGEWSVSYFEKCQQRSPGHL